MNVFILDYDVEQSAKYHVDKHVVKMILETAQLICTASNLSGCVAPYKSTHINHPCSIWARTSLSNWKYLKSLAFYLNKEYKYRFSHTNNHKSWDVIKDLPDPILPEIGLTPFALAMPDEYKVADAVESYRKYYIYDKWNLACWTKRGKPSWFPYTLGSNVAT